MKNRSEIADALFDAMLGVLGVLIVSLCTGVILGLLGFDIAGACCFGVILICMIILPICATIYVILDE